MPKKADKELMQISMNMPVELNQMLDQLIAQITIDSKVKIHKTEIYLELLGLVREAKIKTKNIQSVKDITAQIAEYCKRKK